AMIVAILALHLTLTAKYWSPQTLAMRRRRETGRRASPVARLFAIRFYSFTEKLVLALLFAGALLLLALADWNDQGGNPPPALGSGTLASPSAREAVADGLLGGQRGAYVRGYAAQASGEDETAAAEYRAAGDYPPALNNLGALTGNEALFQ